MMVGEQKEHKHDLQHMTNSTLLLKPLSQIVEFGMF